MIVSWFILRKLPLFAIYGLCIQTVVEGIMKYFSICKWFGKMIIPLKNYIILWAPVVFLRIIVDSAGLNYSLIALIIGVLIILVWNIYFAYQDKMVKTAIINLKHKKRNCNPL
jgi:hypothetical protein